MSESTNHTNFQALVINDDAQLRDQLRQGSSPARRVAAFRSDIELVGRSQAFIEVMKQVGRVANTNQTVFLTGESGTGKALVAAAIHQRSSRADKPCPCE